MILFLEICWVTVSKILMFWNFNLDPIFLTHVNLRSRSIFLSLDWKNSGRRGETKKEPDTNLLWNVYDPLFFIDGHLPKQPIRITSVPPYSRALARVLRPWKSSGKPFYWLRLTAHFFVLVYWWRLTAHFFVLVCFS